MPLMRGPSVIAEPLVMFNNHVYMRSN